MCRQNCVCRLHIETCVQENVVKLTQTRIWSFSMILRLGMSTHLWEMTFSGLSCLWDVTGLATKTAIDRFERFNEFTALVQRSLTDRLCLYNERALYKDGLRKDIGRFWRSPDESAWIEDAFVRNQGQLIRVLPNRVLLCFRLWIRSQWGPFIKRSLLKTYNLVNIFLSMRGKSHTPKLRFSNGKSPKYHFFPPKDVTFTDMLHYSIFHSLFFSTQKKAL